MPQLLAFLPCEIVIINDPNQTPSLINVLIEITMGQLPDIVPENAAVPFRWCVFTQWKIAQDERARQWEQRSRMKNPAGQPIGMEHVAQFAVAGGEPLKAVHRMIGQLDRFPILPAGEYQLEVAIREIGTEAWIEQHDYPIIIKRQ